MSNYYPMQRYTGGGGSVSLTGDAQAEDVLSPKTFYNNDSNTKLTGTISSTTTSNVSVNCGASTNLPNNFHGNGNSYKGTNFDVETAGTASPLQIVNSKIGYVNGEQVQGIMTNHYRKINKDLSFSNSNYKNSDINLCANNFSLTYNGTKYFEVNKDGIYTPNDIYSCKGQIDGVLVANSTHKIYFPKGAVYLAIFNSYLKTTNAYRGSKAYTITTNGGGSSTTALAVPKVTAFGANGTEPIKCTLGADTNGPSEYLKDATYIGYIIIGSCTTACRVDYCIRPLLTPISDFTYTSFI